MARSSAIFPPEPPGASTRFWAVHLAVAAALITLIDNSTVIFEEMALFGGGALLNSRVARRWFGSLARSLGIVYFIVTLPLFLQLANPGRTSEEWLLTRAIYLLLLTALYGLPGVRCGSVHELQRVVIILCASFFFSATFFQSSFFFACILAAAFALFLAFHAEHGSGGRPPARVRLAIVYLILSLGGGIVVFYGFPRTWFRTPSHLGRLGGGDMMSQPLMNPRTTQEAGLSTQRDLLRLANLLDFSRSGAEVLRVRLSLESSGQPYFPSGSIYLRASVFDTYTHGAWTSSEESYTYRDQDDGERDGWTMLPTAGGHTNGLWVRQYLQAEPRDDLCVSLPDPIAIRRLQIKYDPRGVLILASKMQIPWTTEIVSELPTRWDDAALDRVPRPTVSPELQPDLQIPTELRGPLAEFRGRWNANGDPASQIRQMCGFLQNQFSYGPVPFAWDETTDPVRQFLTVSRRGYCTHFATALALLARSIGMPARVAAGFHFVGPPDQGGFYHVRELNAHAWAEILFPGHGWVQFDATPPAERPSFEKVSESERWWQGVLSFLRLQNAVTELDAADQKAILLRLRDQLVRLLEWSGRQLISPGFWLVAVGAGMGLWLAWRSAPLRLRRCLWQRLKRQSSASSVPFYGDLLWLMERHGPPKPAGLTGEEYAAAWGQNASNPSVIELTRCFYRVKYGGERLSPDEERGIQQHLRQFEVALAGRNGRSGGALGVAAK